MNRIGKKWKPQTNDDTLATSTYYGERGDHELSVIDCLVGFLFIDSDFLFSRVFVCKFYPLVLLVSCVRRNESRVLGVCLCVSSLREFSKT